MVFGFLAAAAGYGIAGYIAKNWCNGFLCFDGNTQVTLKNGSVQTIKNLRPGERILTLDGDGKKIYTKVTMVKCVKEECGFVEFSFSDGKKLNITDNHFMIAAGGDKTFDMKTASQVEIGMCVPTDENTSVKVVDIRRYKASERWTVETDPNKTLSANGIIVSSECDFSAMSQMSREELLKQDQRIGTY